MKNLKLLLFGFLTLFFLFAANESHAANFSTAYNVTYAVSENATTKVTFDISLTNNTSQYYASSYKLILGFKDISSVSAKDSVGPITPELSKRNEGTQVSVDFNNRVVGLGNEQNFTVSFDTKEIAQHSGNVWEVNIPGISEQNDFSNFNVKVIPPSSAKNLLFIKPQVAIANNSNIITFDQSQLGNSGISIAYGDHQIYKFNLKYHLKNSNLFPVNTEIALPPNTNYQDIQISSISPEPTNVREDMDGNWIANFKLNPMEDSSVVVEGYAKLYLQPRQEELTQEQIKAYTKPDKYWESDSPEIKKLTKTLKTPRQIYDYVTSKLTYDFSRVKDDQVRLGASKVLSESSSAVCLEFTDLFIAIARSAGIPARAVEGYANTQNSTERPLSLIEDILHAWPEYYDFEKRAWIMVDPTWANTTKGVDYFNVIDLDHFAFVVKGNDSQYPIPAGGYKQKGQENVKDITVEAQTVFPSIKKETSSMINIATSQVSFLPVRGTVVVKNTGNYPTDTQTLLLKSELEPNQFSFSTPRLLPYQTFEAPFSLRSQKLAFSHDQKLTLETPNQVIVKSIKISIVPLNWLMYLAGGLLTVVFFIILSIVIYKSWRIFVLRRAQGSYLRGKSPES